MPLKTNTCRNLCFVIKFRALYVFFNFSTHFAFPVDIDSHNFARCKVKLSNKESEVTGILHLHVMLGMAQFTN